MYDRKSRWAKDWPRNLVLYPLSRSIHWFFLWLIGQHGTLGIPFFFFVTTSMWNLSLPAVCPCLWCQKMLDSLTAANMGGNTMCREKWNPTFTFVGFNKSLNYRLSKTRDCWAPPPTSTPISWYQVGYWSQHCHVTYFYVFHHAIQV